MCQKSYKVFKQFYAVVLTNQFSASRALQVFKHKPTEDQIQHIISTQIAGKIEPTPYIYSEKPKIEILPIQIPVDILY